MRIEDEIKQTHFKTEYQKLNINLLFTANWLNQKATKILRPYKISQQQFNILRILRGRHPEPATVKLLSERMLDRMSNASRLVEKLRQKGYIERISCTDDRRRVSITITDLGLQVVNEASEILESQMQDQLSSISDTEAKEVNRLLDLMRDED